ncbi:MAG TPA: type II toxin-antitoxin system HigB family toxin [Pirellulales bacterium]|nr:type II toxin-antitoxin system HigB family toxin [Pirellulales bacterium]
MRIISKRRLEEYWESSTHSDAKDPLRSWYAAVRHADWSSWADLKASFPKASIVGDCVVFNIRGGRYRLVARVRYEANKVFVLLIMTHKEYNDQEKWQDRCGCHAKPPKRTGRNR